MSGLTPGEIRDVLMYNQQAYEANSIMDQANGKLIGLLALQSPPLSFPARDHLFRYPQ